MSRSTFNILFCFLTVGALEIQFKGNVAGIFGFHG